jgi:hypothetical protein
LKKEFRSYDDYAHFEELADYPPLEADESAQQQLYILSQSAQTHFRGIAPKLLINAEHRRQQWQNTSFFCRSKEKLAKKGKR